jgi:hypothetical protein
MSANVLSQRDDVSFTVNERGSVDATGSIKKPLPSSKSTRKLKKDRAPHSHLRFQRRTA